MHLWQELAALAPLPASCITTHTPSIQQEELIEAMPAAALTINEELFFDPDDLIMQDNHEPYDAIPTYSSTEEQFLLATSPNYLCTDDYWHDSHIVLHEGDDYGAVTDMENSLDMWENWMKTTSQSPTLNKYTSSSASGSTSPGYLSCESSMTFLANTDTSFIDPSQVCSNASSFAAYQHDPHHLCINNPVNEQYDINLSMQSSPISYDRMSFSQGFVYGNAPVTYCGSTASITSTSDDDFFDSGASSFAAIASPRSQALNFATAGASPLSLNLEARASRPQPILETSASPIQQNLDVSYHNMSATRIMRNSSNHRTRQTGEAVSFIVESNTPAIDDGHVWRKYGQKDIKYRMHPRSYYRCAQPDCPIKKQMESSSDKQGFLLITYFGKHNH